MTPPAPTSSASSTSPPATRRAARCFDVVARTAEAVLHAAHGRRRRPHVADIRALLLAGADKVSINTAAVNDRHFVPARPTSSASSASSSPSTPRRFRRAGEDDRWEIFTHGGRKPTGLDAVAFAEEVCELGAGEILLTSMDRDGTKIGYDVALTRAVADAVPVPVIAIGGVGTLDHMVEGIRDGHASAVLAASIFHFGDHSSSAGQGTPARQRRACR